MLTNNEVFLSLDKDGVSVCTFLIKNKDFNCVAHDNSYIVNQDCANGLLSVNHTGKGM